MASALCPVSSTDRVPDSESVDRGSIPLRDTKRKMHPIVGAFFLLIRTGYRYRKTERSEIHIFR